MSQLAESPAQDPVGAAWGCGWGFGPALSPFSQSGPLDPSPGQLPALLPFRAPSVLARSPTRC